MSIRLAAILGFAAVAVPVTVVFLVDGIASRLSPAALFVAGFSLVAVWGVVACAGWAGWAAVARRAGPETGTITPAERRLLSRSLVADPDAWAAELAAAKVHWVRLLGASVTLGQLAMEEHLVACGDLGSVSVTAVLVRATAAGEYAVTIEAAAWDSDATATAAFAVRDGRAGTPPAAWPARMGQLLANQDAQRQRGRSTLTHNAGRGISHAVVGLVRELTGYPGLAVEDVWVNVAYATPGDPPASHGVITFGGATPAGDLAVGKACRAAPPE